MESEASVLRGRGDGIFHRNKWVKSKNNRKIYDVTGRLVHKEYIKKSKIGLNELLITPKNLSAGVYFVYLETDDSRKIAKAVLLG